MVGGWLLGGIGVMFLGVVGEGVDGMPGVVGGEDMDCW